MGWIHNEMTNEKRVYEALLTLYKKSLSSRHRTIQVDGISIGELFQNHKAFIKEFLFELKEGPKQFAEVKKILIQTQNKKRIIYKLHLLDLILHTMLSQILTELIEPYLSPRLFSYRKGRSNWLALKDVTQFIKKHVNRHEHTQDRGLYLLKRDLKNYGDSIPLHNQSKLWSDLTTIFSRNEITDLNKLDWSWLYAIIRPKVEGEVQDLNTIKGIPTGSPITTVILNLYVHDLDTSLENLPRSFYARFGDDILFMTESHEVAQQTILKMNQFVMSAKLAFSEKKTLDIFFNGAGRAMGTLPGRHTFEYLGAEVNFKGTFNISPEKVALFRQEIRIRIRNTLTVIRSAKLSEPLKVLGSMLNSILDQNNQDCLPHCDWLLTHVNSRDGLKKIDRIVWEEVAIALSGKPSPYCFRTYRPRWIRDNLGLKSLVALRNLKADKKTKSNNIIKSVA